MRVISGTSRGLKLKCPKGLNTRPTADKIKESFFNIITGNLYDISFLDLFSGSGAIGIEALSRGANDATFVDNDINSITTIKENIQLARFTLQSTIYNEDVCTALKKLFNKSKKFDIIFLDPPYNTNLMIDIIKNIENYDILKKDGFIAYESHINEQTFETDKFYIDRVKNYKITKIVFLKYKTYSLEV